MGLEYDYEQARQDEWKELSPFVHTKPAPRHGLYLTLLHGRDDPNADMEDWGYSGPMIGPLKWIHVTYYSTLNYALLHHGGEVTEVHISDVLYITNDLLTLHMPGREPKYFGDWSMDWQGPT